MAHVNGGSEAAPVDRQVRIEEVLKRLREQYELPPEELRKRFSDQLAKEVPSLKATFEKIHAEEKQTGDQIGYTFYFVYTSPFSDAEVMDTDGYKAINAVAAAHGASCTIGPAKETIRGNTVEKKAVIVRYQTPSA